MEWISVKAEPPPKGEMFVYFEPRDGKRCIGLAYHTVSGGWRDSEKEWHRQLNPTHWMRLPPPPTRADALAFALDLICSLPPPMGKSDTELFTAQAVAQDALSKYRAERS